ncbi:neural proliferation differentiation and control protein 1 [Microcaecilia unicolor]|uniref:Neural proliferation differentiation and control protein 1 n=1 Tax=Microcaecilia unicolor TaxID=1415580 RepID=A0A6P7YCL8_9AMPH|nr:neural proliferation differentiation and control protein 1 [Microcaecilia unicolor]
MKSLGVLYGDLIPGGSTIRLPLEVGSTILNLAPTEAGSNEDCLNLLRQSGIDRDMPEGVRYTWRLHSQEKCPSGKPLPNLEDDTIDYFASLLAKQGNQPSDHVPPAESSGRNRAVKPNATDQPIVSTKGSPRDSHAPFGDALLLGLVIACAIAGLTALIVAALCWCRLQKEIKLAQKADYMAQKAPGPPPYDKTSPGDKKLAQSAQMYHYQHQKQQMLSMEKHKEEPKLPDSATTSDEENEDGDFTVYECPGLAPTGEMEVKNPLFDDSSLHPSPKSQ